MHFEKIFIEVPLLLRYNTGRIVIKNSRREAKERSDMYSSAFCRVYNEFGWNYFPRAFGEQLLAWLQKNDVKVRSSLDLGCGTGVLCEVLHEAGIEAAGMDLSEGMIAIARESMPEIHYEVGNMITYRPDRRFDLVTCTGDALNHIISLEDIAQIFRNVFAYLNAGGHFIFDILNEKEVSGGEPIDLDFSDTIKAQFLITQDREGIVNLKTSVYENGEFKFEENITETVHDPEAICCLLREAGFELLQCADQLLEDAEAHGTTWFIVARKPG